MIKKQQITEKAARKCLFFKEFFYSLFLKMVKNGQIKEKYLKFTRKNICFYCIFYTEVLAYILKSTLTKQRKDE